MIKSADIIPYALGQSSVYINHMFSTYLLLMVFVISLNRYTLLSNIRWDEWMFSQERFYIHILLTLSISAIVSILTVYNFQIRRQYVPYFGYFDIVHGSRNYDNFQRIQLALPLFSILFYPLIYFKVRTQRLLVSTFKSKTMNNTERNIITQAIFLTVAHLSLGVFMEVILHINIPPKLTVQYIRTQAKTGKERIRKNFTTFPFQHQ
ncbi:unnamed protein product [Auanema sp. JU1783]|nr:unnamed protein product [Auanema sp. JU1783]